MTDGLDILRSRGAPERLLNALADAGMPADAVRRAVEGGWRNWLRRRLRRQAPLSAAELARMEVITGLAVAVAADAGSVEAARQFWHSPLPWLGGHTPAERLARGDIGAIEDLRARINFGIPP